MYTEVEKAYLAGFLDGEGHIGITRSIPRVNTGRHCHYMIVTIANTHKPIMEKLKRRWGGVLVWRKASKESDTIIGNLRLSSIAAANLLREIEPYLVVKKKQAELALLFADELANRETVTKPLTKAEWDRREDLRIAIREINRPGQELDRTPYPEPAPLVCAYCGKQITEYERGTTRQYCDLKCQSAARRKRDKEREAQG